MARQGLPAAVVAPLLHARPTRVLVVTHLVALWALQALQRPWAAGQLQPLRVCGVSREAAAV